MQKPIDRWLGLFAIALGIGMNWIPKTPMWLIGSLIVMFLLLAHPTWKFWWIENKRWRQCCALLLVGICLFVFGYHVWPKSHEQPKQGTKDHAGQNKPFTLEEIARAIKKEIIPPIKSSGHEVQIKLIFKNSRLFTPKRKQWITSEIEGFRNYLLKLGFDVPKELPPIGTTNGKGFSSAFAPNEDPVYGEIKVGEEQIDDPILWRRVYAWWAFEKLFDIGSSVGNLEMHQREQWLTYIYTEYFESSYTNKRPKINKSMNGWVSALWDIRDSCGQDFTDRSLFYSSRVKPQDEKVNPQNEDKDGKNFNKYFSKRFYFGAHVIDNNFQNLPKIGKILKQHGLM